MAISICSGRAWRIAPPKPSSPSNPEDILSNTSALVRREVAHFVNAGADLDDLQQEARLAALAAAVSFKTDRHATLETFTTHVIRSHLISCVRAISKYRYRTVPLDDDLDGTDKDQLDNCDGFRRAPTSCVINSTFNEEPELSLIRGAVQSLPRRQREAIILRFWHDLTLQEIGQQLGISIAAAGKLVQKGLAALHVLIGSQAKSHCCN